MKDHHSDTDVRFLPIEKRDSRRTTGWGPLHVTKDRIDFEIARLLDLDMLNGERRSSEIVHPRAIDFGSGLTPGISVSLNTLRPGERLLLDRDNANRVEFCLMGEGCAQLGSRTFSLARWSTWSMPSMIRREYHNSGSAPLIWLSYSNQPLLERAGVYYSDDVTTPKTAFAEPGLASNGYIRENAPDYPIESDGARLRGYEFLTDIEVIPNKPLLWAWRNILPFLSRKLDDNKRTIMLLYNPATERRNGTTHSFFSTITSFPAGMLRPPPARGHRHSSFAINYHFEGAGMSVVDGQEFAWSAGDLMLSAPSWSEHSHGITERGASVLTVQDHPFQIGIDALVWQEDLDGPILSLGSDPGQSGYVGPRLLGE